MWSHLCQLMHVADKVQFDAHVQVFFETFQPFKSVVTYM